MNSTNPIVMPALTGLDAATQAVAALCYILIATAALLRAPRDIRTRVFFVFSLANVLVFAVPALLWWKGMTNPAAAPRAATALVLAGLGVAALLLFHLTQVFPQRRPWIRTAGIQMAAGYALIPLVIGALVVFVPSNPVDITPAYILAFIIFGFPLLVLVTIVLPVTAIVSLVRSYHEAGQSDLRRARVPIAMILLGQIAGGALALVFAPTLTVIAPNSMALSVLTVIMWAFQLFTPIAFGLAVWKYHVLSISAD